MKRTWLIPSPEGELTLKCSLTMKWPCLVMVVNGCRVQWCRGFAGGRPNRGILSAPVGPVVGSKREGLDSSDVLLEITNVNVLQ